MHAVVIQYAILMYFIQLLLLSNLWHHL